MRITHIYFYILLFTFITIIGSGCQKVTLEGDNSVKIECDDVKTAILNKDNDLLEPIINKLAKDLKPNSTSSDQTGHLENLEILIDRLNDSCDNLTASMICYACMESLPAQSSIKIEVDSSGNTVFKYVYIWTPEEDVLTFHKIVL